MWTLQKSAIFSQKIINLLFYTYMMNHWWYQLCSAFIIDNVSLEGLCAIFYSKARGRHILQNYFFKRERFRWIIHSLLVDFPEPWCVIYEVFLILWHIIIVLSISLKLSHFLLVLCIAFQRLNIFSLILCEAPSPPRKQAAVWGLFCSWPVSCVHQVQARGNFSNVNLL